MVLCASPTVAFSQARGSQTAQKASAFRPDALCFLTSASEFLDAHYDGALTEGHNAACAPGTHSLLAYGAPTNDRRTAPTRSSGIEHMTTDQKDRLIDPVANRDKP